jgi:predicted HD superfamily hydrolase involved in NAD metabolism
VAQLEALEAALTGRISGDRLAHTYRVRDTALELCARFGADREQVQVAALMHDYARAMPSHQLLAEGRRRGLIIDPAEEVQPQLLHGPVAAVQLAEEGLVSEPAVLDAIRWHTTGRPGMSTLEKLIWLADYIEPGRRFSGIDLIRSAAAQDLDRALLMAMESTITFIINRGWLLHVYTVHARNWLLTQQQP